MSERTYGRLLLDPGRKPHWVIDNLAPHVAIAFKRLFPRVVTSSTVLKLSDSDDVRADLLWFMQRYPFETTHTVDLVAGDARVKARMAERDAILLPSWEPEPIRGFQQGKAPYLYQSQAAKICLDVKGLLLGDEVGLGKTVTAATVLCTGAPLPAAVVVQSHLQIQWMQKLEEFTTLRCHAVFQGKPYQLPKADVYIFKYSQLAGWMDYLKHGYIKTVIYDEIQELRNGDDAAKGRGAALLSGRAEIRLGLTATPIFNYGDEIHTIMGFIQPDLLGDREEFAREWLKSGKEVGNPDALGTFLADSGHFLRRTEDDPAVDRSMPPPNVLKIPVAWDQKAAADEAGLIRQLAMSVMGGSFMERGQASRELDSKMRHMTGVAKARSVAAYVRMLLQDTERVILAGWHRDVYDHWLRMLSDFRPLMFSGSETATQKNENKMRFLNGQSRILIMSLRSGAGLDGLQHVCRDAVIGELDWSPQVHHQFIGRLRRPGQKSVVNAHYLHTDDGSDPVLIEMLGIKSDQSRGILDPGQAPKQQTVDDSRIKRLAKYVLDMQPAGDRPCEGCGGTSTGEPLPIVPLSEAPFYPEGPERDALFTAENVWYLCRPCADRVRKAA